MKGVNKQEVMFMQRGRGDKMKRLEDEIGQPRLAVVSACTQYT